jgi:DNA repair protein RadC
VDGVGESVVASFRVIQEGITRVTKEEIINREVLSSWKALLDYCRATMGHLKQEQFRVLYLNRKNILIADDLQESGTVDQVAVYPRELARRALLLSASSVILVHNHPSSDTSPSQDDIFLTKQVEEILKVLGIVVHDHVIVSSRSYFSFKSNGLL